MNRLNFETATFDAAYTNNAYKFRTITKNGRKFVVQFKQADIASPYIPEGFYGPYTQEDARYVVKKLRSLAKDTRNSMLQNSMRQLAQLSKD